MSGLIDGLWDVALLGGQRREPVRNLSTDVLRQVLKVAALSVALTVARPGAALPTGPPAIRRQPATGD
jgi:fructokinase